MGHLEFSTGSPFCVIIFTEKNIIFGQITRFIIHDFMLISVCAIEITVACPYAAPRKFRAYQVHEGSEVKQFIHTLVACFNSHKNSGGNDKFLAVVFLILRHGFRLIATKSMKLSVQASYTAVALVSENGSFYFTQQVKIL